VTRRSVRLAALALLAIAPLSACRQQTGTAAFVGDKRITVSQVQDGVDDFYKDPALAKSGEGREALVRRGTLNAIILQALFAKAVHDLGATVTKADKDKVAADYKKTPSNIPGPLQGAPLDIAGATGAYANAIQSAVSKSATSEQEANAKFADAVTKAAKEVPIEVNPRYGSFDIKSFLQTFSIAPSKDKAVVELAQPAPADPAAGGQQGQPQEGQPQEGQPQPDPQQPS
jgi:hypothetical protein